MFTHSCVADPVTTIVRCWADLCMICGYLETSSAYSWNTAGDLPVLRANEYVIPKENILSFLKAAYNLNSELTEEEEVQTSLIEELCLSKLHPATLYALWVDDTTSKDFRRPPGH